MCYFIILLITQSNDIIIFRQSYLLQVRYFDILCVKLKYCQRQAFFLIPTLSTDYDAV